MLRSLLIVVLLLLSPWRAWAADTMAVQMAMQGMVLSGADQVIAAPVHCPEMAEIAYLDPVTQGDEGTEGSADHPCNNCAFCQVCATVALLPLTIVASVSPLANALPWAPATDFASASVAKGQKPPIS